MQKMEEGPIAENRPSSSSSMQESRIKSEDDDEEEDENHLKGLQRPFKPRSSACNGASFSFQRL